MTSELNYIQEGAKYLKTIINYQPLIGIVLGSGLGDLVDHIEKKIAIPYNQIPHLPVSTAPGHKGLFVFGELQGIPVAIMQGRFHYYEGYEPCQLVRPIRMLAMLGLKGLIVTNAAGAINEDFHPGDFMFIKDHINLMGFNPLRGENYPLGQRFTDMTYAYDKGLVSLAQKAADGIGKRNHLGVYAALAGPNFETPSEIAMLKMMGADVVGMSTVPEVLAARHLDLKILGVSMVSNMAAGILPEKLSHEEVLAIGTKVKPDFINFIKELFKEKDFLNECS